MTQRRVESWWAQWTCVGGTCAPVALPPENAVERLLDAYTSATAPFLRGCFAIPVGAAVFFLSVRGGALAGLWITAGYFLAFGAYCLANFARCREAHCIVTGVGFTLLGLASAWGAVAGHVVLVWLWVAFLVVAVVGHAFEAAFRAVRGTNALRGQAVRADAQAGR